MPAWRDPLTVTTGAANGEETTEKSFIGKLVSIQYVKDATASYTGTGTDIDITNTKTGEALFSADDVDASFMVYPRVQVTDIAGTGLVLNSDDDPMVEQFRLAYDTITVTVTAGGAAKTGAFHFVVE